RTTKPLPLRSGRRTRLLIPEGWIRPTRPRAGSMSSREGLRVVQQTGWRGILEGGLGRDREHLTTTREGGLTNVRRVKGEYPPHINENPRRRTRTYGKFAV